ncbi:MAG: hypothetical protein ACE5FI_07445 [Anaerolineales bacterium]
MSDELLQLFGVTISFLLSLLVFSYLLGDNPMYRMAMHLFVGVASGYATIVVFEAVLIPRIQNIISNPDSTQRGLAAVPLVLGWLVLLKVSGRLAPLGNIAMGLLVGVGAAVAVGGAITGTLFPQIAANFLDPLQPPLGSGRTVAGWAFDVGVILFGTVTALLYFYYGARRLPSGQIGRPALILIPATFGQVFVTIALAALYAGALATAFALLSERVLFMWTFITGDLTQTVLPTILQNLGLG